MPMNIANFVNNHLATVMSHPVNAARLNARGIPTPYQVIGLRPPITTPMISSGALITSPMISSGETSPSPTTIKGKAIAATAHLFVSNPRQFGK
jgi:hypothetical protein